MQRMIMLVLTVAAAVSGLAGAGEGGSRAMSGWFNVTAPNGWRGRRYMDGNQVFAEEFASGASGRIDVWRFYRRGILTSEERDLNTDGKVDFQTRRDPRNGLMTSVLRDTARRGVNDLEIERINHNRWEVRQDRNLDGVTDRILFINAPNDFFDSLDENPANMPDAAAAIPRETWREVWTDDGYTGSITDYFRYNNAGVLTQYGQWDGRRIAWRRVAPDFVPPGAVPEAPPPPSAPSAPFDQYPAQAQQTQSPEQPWTDPNAAVRDPFDMSGGETDTDPYAGLAAPPPEPAPASAQPRMTGLPTDESSARSVPARMRPPGASERRPSRF
jgi:hypothetical protein